ncbi:MULTISPECIES: hypothetical protein [Metallosphaera]|nr:MULTISPECIES: hypothetical protein [Metallosphaera]MCH1771462.1 hypothetical protein [Metallosphaera sedula]MCP6728578.1 hypothetical protein [Metallosphaera sedula]MCY0861416.1 hypothetical protein [Metallosphaera prunae]WPX07156.1 hypothetical protein SOJ17_000907 [Metallosphaera sedula DSM 5348]
MKDVHRGVYRAIREKFQLPSKLAQNCYRDAISLYKGWERNRGQGDSP